MRCALFAAVLPVLTLTACGGVDKTKLEPVYRSAKAVEASTGVGVTYAQFGELLQRFSTELAIARDKASNDAERTVVKNYATAMPLYQDSATLWAYKLGVGSSVLRDPEVRRAFMTKHGLDAPGGGLDADEGIQAIWRTAGVWMAAGDAAYTGAAR